MSSPIASAAAGDAIPGRPAQVTAALYVDLEGIRARYECLICQTVEGPVFGIDDVTAFTATVRTVHAARCHANRETSS